MSQITREIKKILLSIGVKDKVIFSAPPKPEMGDLSLACFELAKEEKKSPVEAAKELVEKIAEAGRNLPAQILVKAEAIGPYVNFYLNSSEVAKMVLAEVNEKNFGKSKIGKKKKIMVEFAHPNTHKAFHIGHLRNAITGESIVRILENVGYKVIRANYQGDVGMHIAKCLYGILEILNSKFEILNKTKVQNTKAAIEERVKFLGEAYASGSQAFEKDEQAREEITRINDKIYSQDQSIKAIYQTTRQWSLEYLDHIYQRLGTHFDRLYFESEVFARGKEIVLEFLDKGVFKKSQGAIIFEGSKYGLHDRVFVNSKGFPTYEAKDLDLAVKQFSEYNPEKIIHVVGKEQTEYFKVVFKALEFTLPQSQGKEYHLNYGWVTLKEGKMSSRTGQVVLGEWLLDEVKKKITETMVAHDVADKEHAVEKIAVAAVKYSMLKTGVKNDIKFDLNESISLTGDSGPYLLYIVARINSILKKFQIVSLRSKNTNFKLFHFVQKIQISNVELVEKRLLLDLSEFSAVTELAAKSFDPSKIVRYLLDLAQKFNEFYNQCPVLKAEGEVAIFRLQLIKAVKLAMERGLYLLGIEAVEEM